MRHIVASLFMDLADLRKEFIRIHFFIYEVPSAYHVIIQFAKPQFFIFIGNIFIFRTINI